MPLKWSWAFGPETSADLNTLGQWGTVSTGNSQPVTTPVRTYAGSVGTRYSMNVKDSHISMLQIPLNETSITNQGWLSGYIFTSNINNFGNEGVLFINGHGTGKQIRADADASTRALNFYVNSVFKGTSSSLPHSTWHHVSIKFDMSTATWAGELWINGVQEITATNSSTAETGFTGLFGTTHQANFPDASFWSDITLYDDLADPCPVDQFVTRISTDLDYSDNGTTPWNPVSAPGPGGNQSPNLQPPIAVGPVVTQPAPLSGDYVVIGTNPLIVKLGISPTNIYGVTSHSYAAGSGGISVFTALAEFASPAAFTSGPGSVIGTNTYVTVTAPVTPSLAPWTGLNVVLLKTEVN